MAVKRPSPEPFGTILRNQAFSGDSLLVMLIANTPDRNFSDLVFGLRDKSDSPDDWTGQVQTCANYERVQLDEDR